MSLPYWYFGILSKVTAAILDMFNDISIKQNKHDKTTGAWTLTEYSVPLEIGSKSKILDEYQQDLNTSDVKRYSNVPRMALMLNVINKEETLQSNQLNTFVTPSNSTNPAGGQDFSFLKNPAWYMADYTLFILTRRMDDMCQIIEQLCPQFQPQKPLNINLINSIGLRISLPLTIDPSISFDVDEDIGEESFRYINVEIPIRVPVPFFLPISTSAVIKEINTRFGTLIGEEGSYIYQLQEFFKYMTESFITESVSCTAEMTGTLNP